MLRCRRNATIACGLVHCRRLEPQSSVPRGFGVQLPQEGRRRLSWFFDEHNGARLGGLGVEGAWRPPRAPRLARLALGAAAIVALTVLLVLLGLRAVAAVRGLVASPPFAAGAPARSSAGLLYSITQGEQVRLVVSGAAGTHMLTQGAGVAAGLASPDGSRLLALVSTCPRCPAQYVLHDMESGASRIIGTAPELADETLQAAWTRDGRRLAFVEAGLDAPSPQIYLLDVTTNERRALAPGDTLPQSWPAWSPDGRRLAYLSGAEQTMVNVVDIASGSITILNDQLPHASALSWSPDGRFLAVLRDGGVWLVSAADGGGVQLQAPGRVEELGGWSPNGGSLLA